MERRGQAEKNLSHVLCGGAMSVCVACQSGVSEVHLSRDVVLLALLSYRHTFDTYTTSAVSWQVYLITIDAIIVGLRDAIPFGNLRCCVAKLYFPRA